MNTLRKSFKEIIIIAICSIALLGLLSYSAQPKTVVATYCGQQGWNIIPKEVVMSENACVFKFKTESGKNVRYSIKHSDDYAIQNQLMEGYNYELQVTISRITGVKLLDDLSQYAIEPTTTATPGLKTLKNFLATAMQPLGSCEYIYGGGWNWQDDGGDVQTQTIGMSPTWNRFFQAQDAHFIYDNEKDVEHTTAQHQGINAYHYAGLDCSGFVGWAIYNTLETEDGLDSYVNGCRISEDMQIKRHMGKFTDGEWELGDLRPGDIVCTDGHVWVYLGGCSDGSAVILHCSVEPSREDGKGGGVMLSALSPSNDQNCEAIQLIREYIPRVCPEWYKRYEPVVKDYDVYVHFPREEHGGLFRWSLAGGEQLSDPEGYANMDAASILNDVLGEEDDN